MTSPRLTCAGLTGGHGTATAFRDVDLAVEAGSVLALLGPNGAGKTTLLLTLAGLLPSQAGAVTLDGTRLPGGRPTAANRAGLVLVPDNRCLFTTLTVEENIRVAARRGGPKPAAMLEIFPDLEKRWSLPAGALSGGEQQMLALARALVQQPRVLLVDELSMGLAPLVVEALFATVRRIAGEHGCAVVLVEQHIGLALGAADSAAVLRGGAVVLHGSADDLSAEPERFERAYFGTAGSTPGSAPGTAPGSAPTSTPRENG
ncbi:branched-chain amino acid transport system ATP-binding protein [Parafrankia irregularis]|uniref:Branched-chain amino acid transport system ATP-binding protein n=1 Tax=Parafrankia irregularis TaxID=795642 RepID=A0A0S4QPJ8_9ACTN|nr:MULTISPECIES: ATP-binding cassette domain-containing protein [Parafrankia]MBE3206093.1 ATP-binding cassette domain-containing protein [Parafrankia sp. CH37]CUU57023.1 branched-chain amino acid transport system ATP-binding protein [Parafrankia irregularis]